MIVPVSQRVAVISAAHTKAHWGITKSAETVAKDFVWEKMREDVKKFVLQCATCLEKQGVNLKEGAHMPRVSHEQGEIVYMDQFLQIFVDNDGWIFMICGPPQAKMQKK